MSYLILWFWSTKLKREEIINLSSKPEYAGSMKLSPKKFAAHQQFCVFC